MTRIATYIQASTDQQEHRHQQESIDEWIDVNADGADVDRYVDLGQSGADDTR